MDIRTRQTDPTTSLLTDKQTRETTTEGKVTVFLENDTDKNSQAVIVLINSTGQVIDSLPTKLGG